MLNSKLCPRHYMHYHNYSTCILRVFNIMNFVNLESFVKFIQLKFEPLCCHTHGQHASSTSPSLLTNDFTTLLDYQFHPVAQTLAVESILIEQSDLSVTVTVSNCCQLKCPVTVSFGTRPVIGGGCNVQQHLTKDLSPGETATFSVETGSVTRESDEEYCFLSSGCGNPGEWLDSMSNLDIFSVSSAGEISGGGDNIDSSGSGLSPGPVTPITATVLLLTISVVLSVTRI